MMDKIFTEVEIREKLSKLNIARHNLEDENVIGSERSKVELEFSKAAGWFVFYNIRLSFNNGTYLIADTSIVDKIIDEEDEELLKIVNTLSISSFTASESTREKNRIKITQYLKILEESGYTIAIRSGQYHMKLPRLKFGE